MAASPVMPIPQFAIIDVDSHDSSPSSRPQTPVSESAASSATSPPTSPTVSRTDTLKVTDSPAGWRRRRSASVSTMETLPTYSGPNSPTHDRKRSRSVSSASVFSEAPSYRTVPDDHDHTVYHIYRQGPKGHMTVHEVSDRLLDILPQRTLADGTPVVTPGWWKKTFTAVNMKSFRKPDHPKHDPRMPAFFVHKPQILTLKGVPLTLRAGPNRHSPVACRFDGNFAWRKWVFDFEDINGEGVLDERGLIADHFPRPKKAQKRLQAMKGKTDKEATGETSDLTEISPPKSPKKLGSLLRRLSGAPMPIKNKSQEKEEEPKEVKPEEIMEAKQEGSPAKSTEETENVLPNEAQGTTPEIIAPKPVRVIPALNVVAEPDTAETDAQREALAPAASTPKPIAPSPSLSTGSKTPTPSTRNTPALKIDTSRSGSNTPVPTAAESTKEKGKKKVRDDLIEMTWENKLGRQYHFNYKGVDFFWKGTSTQKDVTNKKWGALNRFSHLKFIAELPYEEQTEEETPNTPKSPCLSPADAEFPRPMRRRSSISSIFSRKSAKEPKRELVLATYTCTWGKRKAGRLVVDHTIMEKVIQHIAKNSSSSFVPTPTRRTSSLSSDQLSPASMASPTKKRYAHVFPTPKLPEFPVEIEVFEKKRLNEIVVATCIAMANSEQEKRHMLSEATFLALEIVQNVAGG